MKPISRNFQTYYLIVLFLTLGMQSCDSSLENKLKNKELSTDENYSFYPNKSITDGPYIYVQDTTVLIKWLDQNKLFEVTLFDQDYSFIERNFGFNLDTVQLYKSSSIKHDNNYSYQQVKKYAAISDMHGQLDITLDLLKKYGIIDKQNNWSYGEGHLIVDGDIFDRGDKVTEILWLIYKLSNQAERSGGKVHYLIGNHELMALNKDLRYLNIKYKKTEQIMNTPYDQLFSKNTIIGRWLRTRPVILTINDVIFVHAGISPEFIKDKFTQKNTNYFFQNNILGLENKSIESDTLLRFLKGRNGPVWYRGYFRDSTFTEKNIDEILDYFNKNRIVVGHTSFDSIVSLYNGKIFGIDASIKKGKNGELLIYENKKFYRATLKSGKIEL